MTAVHLISRAALVDRELRCQGSSLQAWAEKNGIGLRSLIERLNRGTQDAVVHELAETLGVSVTALQPTGT